MAILASAPERNWPAQDNVFPFAVDPALTQFVITLEHPDWPEGDCIGLVIFWEGVPGGVFTSGGGPVLGKDGLPTGGTKVLTWTCNKPRDVANGEAHIQLLQGLRTAMLVEGF